MANWKLLPLVLVLVGAGCSDTGVPEEQGADEPSAPVEDDTSPGAEAHCDPSTLAHWTLHPDFTSKDTVWSCQEDPLRMAGSPGATFEGDYGYTLDGNSDYFWTPDVKFAFRGDLAVEVDFFWNDHGTNAELFGWGAFGENADTNVRYQMQILEGAILEYKHEVDDGEDVIGRATNPLEPGRHVLRMERHGADGVVTVNVNGQFWFHVYYDRPPKDGSEGFFAVGHNPSDGTPELLAGGIYDIKVWDHVSVPAL